MKNKLNLIAAVFALLVLSSFANASVTVPLNTGYDHWLGVPYTGLPKQDIYWSNLSNPVNNIWTPSYAVLTSYAPALTAPFANSQWISSRMTYLSASPTTVTKPDYTIFRKCFCLQNGYIDPRINFRLRADDNVTVWLNTIMNPVLTPSTANFGLGWSNPYYRNTNQGFRVGSNCLYVLVEDFGGATAFILEGDVSATAGLFQTPSTGSDQSYAPCSCGGGVNGQGISTENETKTSTLTADDTEIIKGIVRYAEQRRIERIRDAENRGE